MLSKVDEDLKSVNFRRPAAQTLNLCWQFSPKVLLRARWLVTKCPITIWTLPYYICPQLQAVYVFCIVTHSQKMGADISHSATINCSDGKDQEHAVMSVSRTGLLPGSNAHSHLPVAKMIQLEVFRDEGSPHYEGNDREALSGQLEI
jgi:hypothetical protein